MLTLFASFMQLQIMKVNRPKRVKEELFPCSDMKLDSGLVLSPFSDTNKVEADFRSVYSSGNSG